MITPHPTISRPARASRPSSHAATLMLALFVFAAVPTFSVAQGLDAAVLAELLREQGRAFPTRDHGTAEHSRSAATVIARRIASPRRACIVRPRVALAQRTGLRAPAPAVASERSTPRPRVALALLDLPPPAC